MVSLRDRAYALENQFAHEQSFLFSAQSRRNRLIGLWAAEEMGLPDPDAYATELCLWSVDHFSDADVVAKLSADFSHSARSIDMDQLAGRMRDLLSQVFHDMRVA